MGVPTRHDLLGPRAAWVLAGIMVACAPVVSTTPLFNAEPEGTDSYYYGSHTEPSAQPERPSSRVKAAAQRTRSPVPPVKDEERESDRARGPEDTTPEGEDELDSADAGVPEAAMAFLGTFSGTDTVVFQFPGAPQEPQVDDAAKIKIKNRRGAPTLIVIDSNRGSELCAVAGKAEDGTLVFDEGQDCFMRMLGPSTTGKLESGRAELDGDALEVEMVVRIELSVAGTFLAEGTLDYRFEGEREAE